MVGAFLIVLLAVIGITILRIRQLIWLHLFVGLVLLGPITAKTASTGYRFIRYYTRDQAYRPKGPPKPLLRAIAPLVLASTVVVFVSGIALLIVGPHSRQQFLALHKVSFIVWLVFMGVHVVGHLEGMVRSLRSTDSEDELPWASPGAAGRWIVLVGAFVGGVVLAVALIPDFAPWTAHAAFPHHRG